MKVFTLARSADVGDLGVDASSRLPQLIASYYERLLVACANRDGDALRQQFLGDCKTQAL